MHSLKRILDSGQVTSNTVVSDFEGEVASFLGVSEVVAVSSCTSGLILTMQLLGLRDVEVLMPTFTFAATAHAAYWNRCSIVFVDSDPRTFNVSVDDLVRKISKRTAGILVTHVFGNPCEMDLIEQVAREHNLKLICDAAHGFGTSFEGKRIGGFGDAEIFSCSPTKILTTLEGGLISTKNRELAQELRAARNYGVSLDYTCDIPGLNARMTEIGAALGREILKDIEEVFNNRNKYARLYRRLLGAVPGLGFQWVTPKAVHGFKDFAVLVNPSQFGIGRDLLALALEKEGIATKKYFSPLVHQLAAYRNSRSEDLPNAERLSSQVICLPLFSYMREETIERICKAVMRIHHQAGDISALEAGEVAIAGPKWPTKGTKRQEEVSQQQDPLVDLRVLRG